MSRGSKFKGLLYRVALGEVPELDEHAAEVYACARELAKPMNVFEEAQAKHLLLRSMRHLMKAASEVNGRTGTKRKKVWMNTENALPAGDAVNTSKPELVFDPDTNTYGIIVDRVEVIRGLDPVGLRHGTKRVSTEEEASHFAEIRRIAEGIRARGDCGCSVVLADGVIASLSLNVKDPWASQTGSVEK